MATKMMAVKDLAPGGVLADAVLSVNGKVLLGKDVVLTSRHISLLNTWDVQGVFIHIDEEAPAAEPEPPAVTNNDSAEYMEFVQNYDSIVTNTVQSFDFIRRQNVVPVPRLKDTAGTIHTAIGGNGLAAMNCLLVSDYKLADFVSRHSVMVAFFAGIIARQMKWSEADIQGVALAGLLHDMGSLVGGKSLDNQNKAHIAEAAGLLRETKGLSNEVILGIIQHRECMDGSGYPSGVNGLKIHPYAKIIAVADTFHARAYTDEYANPFPVLDMLSNEMFGKLDPGVCHTFISRVRDSLLNSKMLLSSGQEAEIIYFHPNGSSLPVVRMADAQILDLSQHSGSTISRIIPVKGSVNIAQSVGLRTTAES
ncbi:MAG: HD domain-containing protein [Negativicutes bacterium]|nr:HD domain-containing protein [Negativicutes bacterium]